MRWDLQRASSWFLASCSSVLSPYYVVVSSRNFTISRFSLFLPSLCTLLSSLARTLTSILWMSLLAALAVTDTPAWTLSLSRAAGWSSPKSALHSSVVCWGTTPSDPCGGLGKTGNCTHWALLSKRVTCGSPLHRPSLGCLLRFDQVSLSSLLSCL